MYSYLIGMIVDMAKDHIVLENNGIGYLIYGLILINLQEERKRKFMFTSK